MKSIGKELFVQSLPELMEVASKKKSFKRAAKSALKKTVKNKLVVGFEGRETREKEPVEKNESYREVGLIFSPE